MFIYVGLDKVANIPDDNFIEILQVLFCVISVRLIGHIFLHIDNYVLLLLNISTVCNCLSLALIVPHET